MRDPSGIRGEGGRICRENTIAIRAEIISSLKEIYLPLSSDFAEKGFLCTKFVFLYFLTIFNPLYALFDPLKPIL